MSAERPPAGIAVTVFFESWLPEAYAAAGRSAHASMPLVRVTLSGAGGGAWDVQADEDRLLVVPADRDLPDVWLRQTVADFRAALEGDPDLPSLVPPNWNALDLLFVDPRDADLLKQVSGRIRAEVTGRRARRWAIDVAFGKVGVAAGHPRTTVRIDGATLEGMAAGTIPPMQPLLDGRLKVEGDRALAMQLLLLMGSRFGRR